MSVRKKSDKTISEDGLDVESDTNAHTNTHRSSDE